MQKKVLVIGCGFSSGSYESKQPTRLGELITDELASTIGWYDHLDVLQGRTIDVYSMPNLGWLAYAHLLRGLRDSGELALYDLLIIQETYEPRFAILGNQFMPEFVQMALPPGENRQLDLKHWCYRASPNNLIMTCDDTVSFYRDFVSRNIDAHRVPQVVAEKVLADIASSSHVNTMLFGSQSFAMQMAKEAGMQTIVISFFDPCIPCVETMDRGPVRVMSNVYQDICLPNRELYLTTPTRDSGSLGGRLTRDGNAKLGNLFNDRIKALPPP